jgi:hypothetical protein
MKTKRTKPEGLKFTVRQEEGDTVITHQWDVPARALPEVKQFAKPFAVAPQVFLTRLALDGGYGRRKSNAAPTIAFQSDPLPCIQPGDLQTLKDYAEACGQTPAEYIAEAVKSVFVADTEEFCFHPETGKPIGHSQCFERFVKKSYVRTAGRVEPLRIVPKAPDAETFTVTLPAEMVSKLRAYLRTRPGISMEAAIVGNAESWQEIDHSQREREFVEEEAARMVELQKLQNPQPQSLVA